MFTTVCYFVTVSGLDLASGWWVAMHIRKAFILLSVVTVTLPQHHDAL